MRRDDFDLATGKSPSRDLDAGAFRLHFDNLPGPAFMWQRQGEDFRLIAHDKAGAEVGAAKVERS